MTTDPLGLAHETLSKLITSGATPARVTQEIGDIIAGWANEPEINPGVVAYRIAAMWDSLTRDEADLREHLSDMVGGNPQEEAAARRVLAAMGAAVETLAAADASGSSTINIGNGAVVFNLLTIAVTNLPGFALFSGTGQLTSNVAGYDPTAGLLSFSTQGNGAVTFSATANATAVPEPVSLAIVGAGLLGLGLVRRKQA